MLLDTINAEEIAAHSVVEPFHARIKIRLDSGLLDQNDPVIDPKECYPMHRGWLTIQYSPRTDQPRFIKKGAYIVKPVCEVSTRTRYQGWEDYCEHADEDKVQKFVKEWSFISEEYFNLAYANRGVVIPIGYDLVRYNEHLKEEYRKRYGEEPPPDVRLLSVIDDAETSLFTNGEYKKNMYENQKGRKAEQRRMKSEAKKK